jgi:D-amino-acid dehydrogenase
MPTQKKIIVIGGGVIGLCSAYYSALRGHRVTVIDRESEVREGCSYGNAGMVVPSHFVPLAAPGMVAMGLRMMWNAESPFYIKPRLDWDLIAWSWKFWRAATAQHVARAAPLLRDLSYASRALFEQLAELPASDIGLVQRGLLMLCKTQHSLDEEAAYAARANALGVPATVLDAAQAAALDPDVRMAIAGAVHFPNDCHLSPMRFMAMLKAQCVALGVTFHWDTEVSGLKKNGARIDSVTTAAGEWPADEVILAGGSWSPTVSRCEAHASCLGFARSSPRRAWRSRRWAGRCALAARWRLRGWTNASTQCACVASSSRCRVTFLSLRRVTLMASSPGVDCARARPMACLTWGVR